MCRLVALVPIDEDTSLLRRVVCVFVYVWASVSLCYVCAYVYVTPRVYTHTHTYIHKHTPGHTHYICTGRHTRTDSDTHAGSWHAHIHTHVHKQLETQNRHSYTLLAHTHWHTPTPQQQMARPGRQSSLFAQRAAHPLRTSSTPTLGTNKLHTYTHARAHTHTHTHTPSPTTPTCTHWRAAKAAGMHQELCSGRWRPPVRLPAVDAKPPPLPEVVAGSIRKCNLTGIQPAGNHSILKT